MYTTLIDRKQSIRKKTLQNTGFNITLFHRGFMQEKN